MNIQVPLNNAVVRIAVLLLAVIASAWMVLSGIRGFIPATLVLASERVPISGQQLAEASAAAPDNSAIRALLARAEQNSREYEMAEQNAREAVRLSPFNHNFRVVLANVQEARGDRAGAAASLAEALRLAPNNTDIHWQLANVLVRDGKLEDALPEFRKVTGRRAWLLPATLDLIWRTTGNLQALETIAGPDARARIGLAQYLLKQSLFSEAASVFGGVDPAERLTAIESAGFFNDMIAAGHADMARPLWVVTAGGHADGSPLYNGGFESPVLKNFNQFDWMISRTEFARINIDGNVAHSGNRSLRIDFNGHDTTRLDNEIRQRMILKPGARYALDFFVRSDSLSTPEGPVVAATAEGSPQWLGASQPVQAGTEDWYRMRFEFTVPADSSIVYISIKRKPKFSYDQPTRGTIWFDDFSLGEAGGSSAEPQRSQK